MRRSLLTAVALLIVPTVQAIPIMPFVDTPTFAKRAKEVVIADCVDPDVNRGPKNDGLTLVTVDVVKTLKGDRKTGTAKLVTIGQPMEKGKRYMMVSFGGSAFGSDFLSNGELAVVEVPAGFDLKKLEGKTLVEQMQAVYDARRADVAARQRRLEVEKAVLEQTAEKKDTWSGEFTRLGGWDIPGRDGHHVKITKDDEGFFHINLKGYETYQFTEVKPGVLHSKVLGTITRGELKFEGRDAQPILKAEFCYEYFYLFGPK